jgi:RHH-type proline utilization regulon transcriptional repressor/proline dehydrogenase/delta 1-pyrroline-5-carboxylate dehydrogenase
VLCIAGDPQRLKVQHDLVHTTGNRIAIDESDKDIAAVLFAGSEEELRTLNRRLVERPGRIVPLYLEPYPRDFLFDEFSLSVNTAAAGGNASLMAIG